VATALARVGQDTLFIDMHPAYGDAAVLLGVEPRFSMVDALDNTHRLDLSFFEGLTARSDSGVALLASSDHASMAPMDMHRVRLLLDFAVRNYRYTVLDVPRSNPAILDALEGATSLFVVTNQELASVSGANRVAGALSRRYTREKVALVVSRFDQSADIGTTDIEQTAHAPVRFTFPSDYRLALRALNDGRPFVLDRGSKLAAAVLAFAKELSGIPPLDVLAPKSSAFRTRFAALRWMTS
jgi:pilus assembly protein CpaE